MHILDAARNFDDCNVLDSNDVFLFKAQLDIYDKSTSEGIASSRRTLNTAPGSLSIPANKIIKIDSKFYIAGREIQDSFQGDPIRDSLVLQETNSDSEVFNLETLLNSGAAEISTRSFLAWRKTKKEEERTSEYFNVYDIYFSVSSAIKSGQVISLQLDGGNFGLYFVATIEFSIENFSRLVTYELGAEAHRTVTYFSSQGYDPASGVSFSAPIFLDSMIISYKVGYELERYSSAKFEVGDSIFFILNTASIKAQDEFESSGKRYRVISVLDTPFGSTGVISAHCRLTDV